MRPSIPHITTVTDNFEIIEAADDPTVLSHFVVYAATRRTRLFMENIEYHTYRVSRSPGQVTLHLLGKDYFSETVEVARFSFLPSSSGT